ncbi:MAG: serine hydrolase [Chitinophagales bacterium]
MLAKVDSLRLAYHIPELAYTVVSEDSVFDLHVIGVQRAGTDFKAQPDDRFRIGSNTKAVTGLLAAQLVKKGVLSWNTGLFDLFPELKSLAKGRYGKPTLLDLLSFRTPFIPYTYTYEVPHEGDFKGDEREQRYHFIQWILKQKPICKKEVCFSNPDYVAAALMMEKASRKTYEQLVQQLNDSLQIDFGFGAPNVTDTMQPWGHTDNYIPEAPKQNQKLNWLQAAGNLNISLPQYVKFMQEQLRGLRGHSKLLSQKEFEFLHFGLPSFSVGWFNAVDSTGERFTYNYGNPGSFLSKACVFEKKNRAMVILCNIQTTEAETGLNAIYNLLYSNYCSN